MQAQQLSGIPAPSERSFSVRPSRLWWNLRVSVPTLADQLETRQVAVHAWARNSQYVGRYRKGNKD
jgi:hypothetical protein